MKTPSITHKLHEFFLTLADAVAVFRSGNPVPRANCNGCQVLVARSARARGKVLFKFLDKRDRTVNVVLNMSELAKDPKQYIDMMLEDINSMMKHVNKEQRIIVPVQSNVSIIRPH